MKRRTLLMIPLFVVMVLLIAGFILSIDLVSSSSIQRQKEELTTTLEKQITDYYAWHGMYPDTIETLKEEYGLTYNEDLFFVDYQIYGKNLRPEVTILERK